MCCCCFLWKRFSESLAVGIGLEERNKFSQLIDAFWQYLIKQDVPPDHVVNAAKVTLKKIETSDVELDGGSELATFGLIELLGCIQKSIDVFENGSAKSASTCSEHVINWTDHELAFLSEVKDPLSHPEMLKEIIRQDKIINYLNHNDLITEEDKNHFCT